MTELQVLEEISQHVQGMYVALGCVVFVAGFFFAYLLTKEL